MKWVGGALAVCAVAVAGVLAVRHSQTPELPANPHVAVIRFHAEEEDLQVLADGLTAMTLDGLAPIVEQTRGEMWSLPRRNMTPARFDSLEATRRQFGINLGVTGRLARRGENLRLSLSIVDAFESRTLREATIEDSFDNLGSFQREPVLKVAQMLGLELDPATIGVLESRSTNHAGAFSLYVRAMGMMTPALEDANAETVEALLVEAIKADPGYAPAREAMAAYCLERYRATRQPDWIERGLESVEAVLKRSPTEPVYRLEARLLEAAGRNQDASAALVEGVREFPSSGFLQLTRGITARSAGQLDEAERAFQRAINLVPGYWPTHYWMGQLDYDRGRFDAAANQWRTVISCAPEYHGGYTNLGMAFYSLDRHADAREMFERAVELTGGADHYVLSNLGTLYFEASRFGDAAKLFEQAAELFDGSHTYWGNLGQAYAASRDPDRAERPFRRAIELVETELVDSPEDAGLLGALASYHAMLGERDEAKRSLDAAIGLDPTDPNLMAVIGETFEDIGMRDEALSWIGRAIAGGVPVSRFENRPSMRALVDDQRFREVATGVTEARPPRTEGRTS